MIYHSISRFVGQEWFIEGEEERARYLELMRRYLPTSDWRCFSYAVMSNHIHLGLLAGSDPLVSWMRDMHSEFADWITHRRRRIGHVFVRGPKLIEVEPERVTRLVTYIHRNPVRAGVVADPRESTWTSHRAYVGLASKQPWLDVELGLSRARITAEELEAIAATPVFDTKEKRKRKSRKQERLRADQA